MNSDGNGQVQEAVFSGGTDISATIASGGVEFVFTSGTAIGTTVRGVLDIGIIVSGVVSSAGGTVIDPIVKSHGVLDVFSGGIASNTTVKSGGKEIAFFDGADVNATVSNGGAEIVSSGGTAIGVTVDKGGELIAGGSTEVIANSGGTLFASGANSLIDIVGVVHGGVARVGNGNVEMAGSSSENVTFLAKGSGGLVLDGLGSTYTGKVVGFGFGTSAHSDHSQFIAFRGIGAGATVSYLSANASNTSGTLTVSSGGTSATVTLFGTYTLANFKSSTVNGHVVITDPGVIKGGSVELGPAQAFPQHGIDLPDIAFGAQTTLAYSGNSTDTGGALTVRTAATPPPSPFPAPAMFAALCRRQAP